MKHIKSGLNPSVLSVVIALSLTGCFDDKNEQAVVAQSETYNVTGAAVKGPLAAALVNVYELDESKSDLKGQLVTSGKTSADAKLAGLELQSPLSDNYLVEVIADDTTIDLTTGKKPVITQLVTYITKQQIESNSAIFATPLSTIVIKLVENEGGTATFDDKLTKAVELTKSTLGFGISNELSLFTDAPLLTDAQASLEQQQQTIMHRGAIEAAASIMNDIANNNGLATDDVLDLLSHDLADGSIDAKINQIDIAQYDANALELFQANPDDIVIADDDQQRTLADIKELLISETLVTGNSELELDNFIDDSTEITFSPAILVADNDGDGIDNNADADDDNDGVLDSDDAFPLDPTKSNATDGDTGVGDTGGGDTGGGDAGGGDTSGDTGGGDTDGDTGANASISDFETGSELFTDFDGGVATIITNPDMSGINTSAQVGQMQKFAGQHWGGTTYTLPSAIDIEGTVFTLKVWSQRAVPVLFKLEGMNVERSVNHTGSGWEELTFDFTGETGTNVTAITLIFDIGTPGDASGDPANWTFYFDDINIASGNTGSSGGDSGTGDGDYVDTSTYFVEPPTDFIRTAVDASNPSTYNITQYGAGNISDGINPNGYTCTYDYGNWIGSAGVTEPGVSGCDPIGSPTYRHPQVIGDIANDPTPTHKWWGSIPFHGEMAIGDPSQAAYITPDPIAARVTNKGVRVLGIPSGIRSDAGKFLYEIPDPFNEVFDGIAVANSAFDQLDAYLKDYSDGSVTVQWQSGNKPVMEATFVHGSPYIYFKAFRGQIVIKTKAEDGGEKGTFYQQGNNLGIWTSVAGNRNDFLITGEGTTSFDNIASNAVTVNNETNEVTVTLLPPNGATTPSTNTADFFSALARNVVRKVDIDYAVNRADNSVTVSHNYLDIDGNAVETAAGLLPMAWKNSDQTLSGHKVRSARGMVQFSQTAAFTYELPFVGVLPTLPSTIGDLDNQYLIDLVTEFYDKGPSQWNLNNDGDVANDTYWAGKSYGKMAEMVAIARSIGMDSEADEFIAWLKSELADWFTADTNGSLDTEKYFVYDEEWSTLLGMQESFASHQQLNDHHFHYGYFVRAAAEICRVDAAWCGSEQFGPMIDLLIRDYAASKDDGMFPYLRNFDPANGFSWASGNANFTAGNNNESTSEAANAYGAIALYGMITGNDALIEKGMYLHASSTSAYWEYWNNIDRFRNESSEYPDRGNDYDNFPADYNRITTSIIWGNGTSFSTWFSGAYAHILGIQGLPLNPLVLHVGQYPDYMEEYVALGLEESSNGKPSGLLDDHWRDIWWNLWAMTDADASFADYQTMGSSYAPEMGESKAHTYHWVKTWQALGHLKTGSGELTANHPAAIAFDDYGKTTYIAYNFGASEITVTYSDGQQLNVAANSFEVITVGESTPPAEGGDTGGGDTGTGGVDTGVVISVADFEADASSELFTDFDGGVATITANPDMSGINTSAQVGQMQKFAGQHWGGTTYTLPSAIDIDSTVFTMKVWSPRAVPVLFKLEGMNIERSVNHTGSGWEELTFDFTGETGTNVTAISLIFDIGTPGDAGGDAANWTFYFDDINIASGDTGGGDNGGDTGSSDTTPSDITGIDFETDGAGATFAWNVFENLDNPAVEIVANPYSGGTNPSATVAMFTARQAGAAWAGAESAHGEFGPITLDATNSIVKVMVYKTVISDVAVKFAIANGGAQPEIKVANTLINEWEELSFDFSGQIGTAESINIDQIIIFPDFNFAREHDNVVYFDNISFHGANGTGGGDTGTGGGDTGTGTEGELLTNGSFENGIDGWNGGNVVLEGDNNVYVAEVAAPGNPWDVNLSQTMTLIPDTAYVFSFKAKASVARSIIAGLGLFHDPWSSETEDVALTTEWQTFSYTLTTTGFGDDNSRVLFDMGVEAGTVYLDDVSVTLAGGDTGTGGGDTGTGGGTGSGVATISFEAGETGAAYSWNVFENTDNPAVEVIANPDATGDNTSTTVAKFTARSDGAPWAGAESAHGDFGPMTLDATNSIVKIMVYKTVISDVALKFAIANGGAQPEIKVANTLVNQWEELSFDFSGQIGTFESINIDQIIVFPDFDSRIQENVVYFDNISFSDGT